MKILGINPGHNGAVSYVVDGKVIHYSEEERLSSLKFDGNPFRGMINVLQNAQVTDLVIGGTSNDFPQLPWTQENPYTALARKFNPNIKTTLMGHLHHMGHAASAFYGSGFDQAVAVVVDGSGSLITTTVDQQSNATISGYETESIFMCGYPHRFDLLYRRCATTAASSNHMLHSTWSDGVTVYDSSVTITKAYEAVSEYLGFGFIEAGKTMGLGPYGNSNPIVPDFFVGEFGNKNLLIPSYPAGAYIDESRWADLRRISNPTDWHRDFSKVSTIAKDLAWKVQRDCEDKVAELINRAMTLGNTKNVVLSGGFALNCVANYEFLDRFNDVNFWIDPIAHDGGTAIGLAKLLYHANTASQTITPLTSIYLGAIPNYQNLNEMIAQTNLAATTATTDQIATLIAQGEIVAVFQGAAEGGPRALGNRSIVYDPRVPNGKDIVNRIKGREWFRPFAGSVLLEDADEWFDMRGLPESPFMMYAVNVHNSKIGQLPAITHIDGTCRVQTVTRDQNPNWYDLISAFKSITNCPVLFNTSFNLAGSPLVESVADAINTLMQSEIRLLWLPDINLLLSKPQQV